jgi:hypothetical protein
VSEMGEYPTVMFIVNRWSESYRQKLHMDIGVMKD